MRFLLSLIFSFAAFLPELALGAAQSSLGEKPPEWTPTEWLNSKPLSLAELSGKVVVVRWWTGPGCPYCAASVPGLNTLWKRHRNQGLVVIGMYHHKSDTPLTAAHVSAQAKKLGIEFPIAIDRDWKTLRAWWLDKGPSQWTSVTFVIGRDGLVKHIHPGGALVEGEPDYKALEAVVMRELRS